MKLKKNQLATTDELNPIFDEIEGSIKELRSSIDEKITLDDLPEVEPLPKSMEVSLKGVSILTLKGDKGEQGDKGDKGDRGNDGYTLII